MNFMVISIWFVCTYGRLARAQIDNQGIKEARPHNKYDFVQILTTHTLRRAQIFLRARNVSGNGAVTVPMGRAEGRVPDK
jgi:hypothetical protein